MQKRGFSLLEVLIALAIVGLVLVAILKLQLVTTMQTYSSTENFQALIIALNEAEELTRKQFAGESEKEVGGYKVEAKTGTVSGDIPAEKLNITVSSDRGPVLDLNLYHLK